MTYHSKNFATTPSPYSWLIVAVDTAINAEHQHPHQPEPERVESKPKRSQKTTPSSIERIFDLWRMLFRNLVNSDSS